MHFRRNIAFAALGGILMGLTPDPFSLWILAWVALIPLWVMTQRLKVPDAMLMGAIWGLFYHGMALFWITGVHPMTWLGVPWLASLAIAITVWLIITFVGLLLSSLWAGGMAWLTQKLSVTGRVIVACAMFCGLEAIWSLGPLYWTALGYTQSPHDLLLLQISKLSGQQAVTAAIVAVNGLLAETILHFRTNPSSSSGARWRSAQVALGLLLCMGLYGAYVMQPERTIADNGKAIKAGIIQGNIPNPVKLKFDGLKLGVERYTEGYEKLARADVNIILTPETALPFLYPDADPRRSPFDDAIQTHKILTWMGGFGRLRQPNQTGDNLYNYTNSLFLLNGSAKTLAQYDKVRLVPIGEYIPFKAILGGLIKRLSPLKGEVEAGKSDQIVDTPWGRVIVGICYESAYPAHFRYQAAAGGQLIFTASNNAHYAETMPAQHHAQDVARAIETDRWAVRATNTGYSGIVDPNGRTLWLSGINTYETHAETVYLRQTETLYVKWGDWLTPLLVLLSAGIILKPKFNR
jgi:apolipoprotein N-acyltransferase